MNSAVRLLLHGDPPPPATSKPFRQFAEIHMNFTGAKPPEVLVAVLLRPGLNLLCRLLVLQILRGRGSVIGDRWSAGGQTEQLLARKREGHRYSPAWQWRINRISLGKSSTFCLSIARCWLSFSLEPRLENPPFTNEIRLKSGFFQGGPLVNHFVCWCPSFQVY